MTDKELRQLVAANSEAISRLAEDAEKKSEKLDKYFRETEKQIRALGREIGNIGNSLGRYTEGLFTPSLDRILLDEFGLETVVHRAKRGSNGFNKEIDAIGYSNSDKNVAVVVEMKATLRDADITEFLDTLKQFPMVYTDHKDKRILGMMAAVDISPEQKARLESLGIYVVRINNDVFRVVSGRDFEPKDFGLKA